MVSIVRQSKFRHVYGEELKEKFEDVKSTALASEGTLVVSNGKYVAFCWETAGPGILAVLNLKHELGRVPPSHPWVKGHTGIISDFEFNPFNENEIATGCEDSYVRLWRLPENKITEEITSPITTLQGHTKKVGLLNFHPSAAYILASAGQDKTIKVWSVERGEVVFNYGSINDNILGLQWSPNGSKLGFTSRDKFARGLDPRSSSKIFEFLAHDGLKPSKLTWIDEYTLATCGFSKEGDRQLGVWDLRSNSSSLKHVNVDKSSGVLYPTFDPDTSILYLTGKGDGNVRYYEITGDSNYLYYLESFKSNTPCKGISFIPKHSVDISISEIMRAVKLTNNTVDLISFRVPRRSEAFQEDIYPNCIGNIPAMSGEEWLAGGNKDPIRIPIQNISGTHLSIEIKTSKTTAEYERELKDAQLEISQLRQRILELERQLSSR
jgi:coronin-1B/1C/6